MGIPQACASQRVLVSAVLAVFVAGAQGFGSTVKEQTQVSEVCTEKDCKGGGPKPLKGHSIMQVHSLDGSHDGPYNGYADLTEDSGSQVPVKPKSKAKKSGKDKKVRGPALLQTARDTMARDGLKEEDNTDVAMLGVIDVRGQALLQMGTDTPTKGELTEEDDTNDEMLGEMEEEMLGEIDEARPGETAMEAEEQEQQQEKDLNDEMKMEVKASG
mmetsp:Transcript_89195/g.247716  ORF Transcript_89195/g.247716 Transcript_89195/m.247716 type:complete len:215 (-) Transcript_89195:114-758(-)|eukprot:CAMPEP_0179058194 /NCGR_PEP_ID=MMETSP0796-20121207/24725_1 /TAXON_ID=73915 /ORGANISM="Pyrodinium bahamense, Strain pbaha01" /LENGTH=214 /DNA_ID=CAMNT_0020754939 /DNA_START=97 /DNA_END=741 /DNA_ORIENTATION=+